MTRHGRLLARMAGGIVIGAGVALELMAQARALECPAPEPLTRPGILKETSAQRGRLADLLAAGDDDNRVRVVVADLRARYPGVENAEIINYLTTAYCPVVEHLTGLGPQEQQARMDQFVGQVVRIVY